MGHTSGLKAIYARLDQAEDILREGYLEAEPNLSIYQNTQTIVELREKVDKQSDDIKQLVTNLSLKNVKLENDMEALKEQMKANQEMALNYYDQSEEMYQKTILEMRQEIMNLYKILDKNSFTLNQENDEMYTNSIDKALIQEIRENSLKPEEIAKLDEMYKNKPSISTA